MVFNSKPQFILLLLKEKKNFHDYRFHVKVLASTDFAALVGGAKKQVPRSGFHGKVLPQWNFHFHGKGRPRLKVIVNF